VRVSRIITLLIAVSAIVSPFANILPGWTPALGTAVCFNALSLLGLNLIFGVVGMFAFGQAAFMALPAYIAGVLDNFGVPFVLDVVVGVAGTIGIAWIMARIFVRLPGIFLAVATLGFGYVVEGITRAFPAFTGGASGLVLTRGHQVGGVVWYMIAVAALVLGVSAYIWLVRGDFWRRLRIVREDELAAAAMGVDVAGTKSRAFVIGCTFAVFAGLLRAYYVGVIIPEDAGVDRSLEQVGMVMVGGLGYLIGPLIGSSLILWLSVITGYSQKYELLIYGAAFLGAVVYARDGIAGLLVPPWERLCARLDNREVTPPNCEPMSFAPSAERAGIGLSVSNVSKKFGGVSALTNISFNVIFGEIFAIIGPNGAGKSTLFNIISGIEAPSGGEIRLDNVLLTPLAVEQRASVIGRSFQVPRLVPDLTVLENVMVRLDQTNPTLNDAQREVLALEQIRQFGLEHLSQQPAYELSLGQRKLVDLTRAAVGDPALVLLDEPAVGLTEVEIAHLVTLLNQLRARGSAVVVVEHNIEFIIKVAERGLVLDHGEMIALGQATEILRDPRVNEAYFGALH
jgi:branched-chain amino acid transport system permease protein